MAGPKSSELAIFLEALEIDEEMARREYLERICADDQGLRAAVEALLAAHFRLGPISAGDAADGIAERPGTVIGGYKLIEQIGEGGFGVVFLAEQLEPVRRKVALKIIKPGMDTRQVVVRFEVERQALALMDHPNIARVLDGGETTTGRPFFVMELIRGVPITEYCDKNRLTVPERLKLFIDVCRAVGHAHQKGIVHRDIKPANVLVSLFDGAPVVKVIDFGVAKATGKQLTDKSLHTGFRQMIGSPLYMSPEQAEMSGQDVDTRADIYALGVLLYELLTGTTPFERERLTSLGYDEIRRIIREEDPPTPSTRLSTLGQAISTVSLNRSSDPRRLGPLMRGDLDWIVMKCLDKDRTRRYETANNLCRDIERFLHDEPIEARPPSALYQARKFARRHRVPLTTASLLLIVLAIGGTVSVVQTLRAAWAGESEVAARLELSAAEQRAAQERASDIARDLKSLNTANSFIESGRLHAQFGDWGKPEGDPNWTRACAEFSEAVNIRPDHSHVWTARGEFYVRLGLWDLAAADLNKAVHVREPESSSAWYFHALLSLYAEDLETYRRACRRMETRFAMGDDALALDETARACLLVPEPVVDRAGLVKIAERALESGRTPWRITNLGAAHLRAGQYDKAVQRLRESREFNASWEPIWSYSILAMAHHYLGETMQARESIDAAAKAYEQRLQSMVDGSPGSLPTNWWNILQSTLHYREARKLIDGAEPRPDHRLWVIRGKSLAALSQHQNAAVSYTRSIEIMPTYAPAHSLRARAYSQCGEWEKALADFDKSVALNPKSPTPLNNLAWNLATCPAEQFRDPKRAVALVEQAIKLQPNNSAAWNTLGVARYRNADWNGAATALHKSINLQKGGDPADWFFLGMTHWRTDRKDSARRWFTHAQQRMDKTGATREEIQRFHAEAAALLGLPVKLARSPVTPLDEVAFCSLVLEADPLADWVYSRRAAARVELKQWDEAKADLAEASQRQPKDSNLWYQHAAAHLGAGDLEGYLKVRAGILEHFGDTTSAGVASNLLYICVIAPVQPHEKKKIMSMAKYGLGASAGNLRLLSAALHRAGNNEAALRNLEDAAKVFAPRAWDWLFLAMIHHELGHADEARQNLKKAVQWMETADRQHLGVVGKHWFGWCEQVEVNQLRREAETLIQGPPPKRP